MRRAIDLLPTPGAARLAGRRALPAPLAFALLASLTVSFLAGASAPTPLYPLYQSQWGFSALAVTVIFGVYAVAVLTALLVLGRLSDHVGRRPVLLAATFVQIVAMALFTTADGLPALLVARVVQGLAAGAALSAIGAGLLDLDRRRGALANVVITPTGTALGGLMAGVLVRFLPAPTQLVYVLLGAVFALQGAALLYLSETVTPRDGAFGSLLPRLRVSAATRGPLLRAAPAIIAAWALVGLLASLGPAMLRHIAGVVSPLLSGMAVFVLAGSAGAAVLLLKDHGPRRLLHVGAGALIAGSALVAASLPAGSTLLYFAGSAIAGIGFGAGFQGGLRGVVAAAAATERAAVLAVVFIIAYLAMGLPAMGAGYLLSRGIDIESTTQLFAALVVLLTLAAVALAAAAGARDGERGSDVPHDACARVAPEDCPS